MNVDAGAQCPRCRVPLILDTIRTGSSTCPYCSGAFEATMFNPPQRRDVTVQLATAGPDGANACANHAGNAAVTSCQRCGLFICSLCEIHVGAGSYCPDCFDRVRAEGSVQEVAAPTRDYAAMAWASALLAIPGQFACLGFPLGALAVYWGSKATAQRRSHGEPVAGPLFAFTLGLLQVLGGLGVVGFFIWALVTG
jgi:hypothetical protein